MIHSLGRRHNIHVFLCIFYCEIEEFINSISSEGFISFCSYHWHKLDKVRVDEDFEVYLHDVQFEYFELNQYPHKNDVSLECINSPKPKNTVCSIPYAEETWIPGPRIVGVTKGKFYGTFVTSSGYHIGDSNLSSMHL